MVTAITKGIKVSVEVFYNWQYSEPTKSDYLFIYRITIENGSPFTIQLLRRHWYIQDAYGKQRQVEGKGVIGKQPILQTGQSHQYMSACNLKTTIGKMSGTYLMIQPANKKTFKVKIPSFYMVAPFQLN